MGQAELESILDETHGLPRAQRERNKVAQDVWTIRFSNHPRTIKTAKARIANQYK